VCSFWLKAPNVAEAWDACGHKTVAAIALDKLAPQTKTKVDAILTGDLRGRHFIDAATWPDDIKHGLRNDPPKAPVNKPWHFVDIPFDATPEQVDEEIKNGDKLVDPMDENSANVVTAIRFYTKQLKGGQGDPVTKADALSW